jgi:hypothetical protein
MEDIYGERKSIHTYSLTHILTHTALLVDEQRMDDLGLINIKAIMVSEMTLRVCV